MKAALTLAAFLAVCWALASQLDQSIYEASPNYDPTVDASAAMLGGDQP